MGYCENFKRHAYQAVFKWLSWAFGAVYVQEEMAQVTGMGIWVIMEAQDWRAGADLLPLLEEQLKTLRWTLTGGHADPTQIQTAILDKVPEHMRSPDFMATREAWQEMGQPKLLWDGPPYLNDAPLTAAFDWFEDKMNLGQVSDMIMGRCWSAYADALEAQIKAFDTVLRKHLPFYPEPVPEIMAGIVTSVLDGDTFIMNSAFGIEPSKEWAYHGIQLGDLRDTWRIRIANIAAPELGDEGGNASYLYLKELLEGRHVYCHIDQVRPVGKYYRVLAKVELNGKDVGERMITTGHARPWLEEAEYKEWLASG